MFPSPGSRFHGTMAAVRWLLVALFWGLIFAAEVRAEDRVLLLEQPDLRPGLCAVLRIQLAGMGGVECAAEGQAGTISERIAHAAEQVRTRPARFALLLERDPDPRLVRMYMVGASEQQAVISMERIEDRPEPDVDRSLALKAYDAFFALEPRKQAEAPRSVATVIAPVVVAPPPPSIPRYDLWLDVGGGMSTGSSTRGLFQGLLGVARSHAALRGELGLGARFLSQHDDGSHGTRVNEIERGPVLSLRALWLGERLSFGGMLASTLWFTSAAGSTPAGARGRDRHTLLGLAFGLDARVRLLSSTFLRLTPALEWLTTHQRYSVDQRVVTDLGHVRMLLTLSLVVALPGPGSP
jgi:hypothetical protein